MYKKIVDLSLKELLFYSLKKFKIINDFSDLNYYKYSSPTILIDRLNRYLLIVKNTDKSFELNFENKKVLELGSGPNFGWMPLAVYMKSTNYSVVEPQANINFLKSNKNDLYFNLFFKYLSKIYPSNNDYISFKKECIFKTSHYANISDVEDKINKYDIIISNSVLEHVNDLKKIAKKIKLLSHDKTIHMHCVDFGNHSSTENVFAKIYDYHPNSHKNVKGINFLRSSDILNIFKNEGINFKEVNLLRFELKNNKIHDYWNKYKINDLEKGVSIFINN